MLCAGHSRVLLEDRKEYRREYREYRDDHEKFDQSKAARDSSGISFHVYPPRKVLRGNKSVDR